MKRYTSLLWAAFILVMGAVLGASLLESHADRPGVKPEKTVTVYTTMPPEQASLLAAEYEKLTRVRVRFTPMTPQELVLRLHEEGPRAGADLVLADRGVLKRAAGEGAFVPYISESTDSVSDSLKDEEGAWTGVWYDPIVFCLNRDYLRTLPQVPESWAELAAYPGIRLGMTDFLAADAASNLYFTLLSVYGEQEVFRWLSLMHPKVVQYVKFLSTPARMAGMGEVDAAVAVQSETLRYMNNGYPLHIVYPADGTAYMLTGVGLLREERPDAEAFIEWLLGDGAQLVLQREGVFFVPANPGTLAYKQLAGKNLVLFGAEPKFTSAERRALLDRWLKDVRFK